MTKIKSLFILLITIIILPACNKPICPRYWDYPDCSVQSRVHYYGRYRGISTLGDGSQVVTQWQATEAPEVSQVSIGPNIILDLDAKDTRCFKIKAGSYMDGYNYIRHEGYAGRFINDSLYLDFRTDEGESIVAGEESKHYTFAGKKM